jgi:hypothetical protein
VYPVGRTSGGDAGLMRLLLVLVLACGVAPIIAAAVWVVSSKILAGIFIPILVVRSMSDVLSGGYLQPCVPSRNSRVGPSFLLFAPEIKLA